MSLCCRCRSHSGSDDSGMCYSHRDCLSYLSLQEEMSRVAVDHSIIINTSELKHIFFYEPWLNFFPTLCYNCFFTIKICLNNISVSHI